VTSSSAPSLPGAFMQLIEYQTEHPEKMDALIAHWITAIGAQRTARWYITAADRDRPGRFIQFVEFPHHAAAMTNSDHPATAEFAQSLRQICDGDITFRNLDVAAAAQM
jgi:hypothetical protein